jgi:two-component system nitrate/nitrite response regulator NarL
MKLITVAIVEDYQLFVDALELALQAQDGMKFVGSATDLNGVRNLISHNKPDVLLLEIEALNGEGLDLISEVRGWSVRTKIVVLTRNPDDMSLMKAVESGAEGFLSKNCSLSELLQTIRNAARGEVVMPSSRLVGLLKRLTQESNVVKKGGLMWERLTPREYEVLHCLVKGEAGEAIAEELSITPLTVRTHIRNLMSKLGVHSRLEAVSFAVSNGIIDW